MGMITCLYAVDASDLPSVVADEEAFSDFVESGEAQQDLDKSWHGLHFLLTGSVADGNPPLDFIMVGGQDLGEATDFGYGPARYFSNAEARELASALQAVSRQELEARFDPAEMMEEIYPAIWDDPRENFAAWLGNTFILTRDWVTATAAAGKGVIVAMS